MRQYKVRTGQVSILANDINAMQEAVLQNIRYRLGSILTRTGFKGSASKTFQMTYVNVAPDRFVVTLSNLGIAIFPDRTVVIPTAEQVITATETIPRGSTYWLYVSLETNYSNDQTGNFKLGHPVDSDGNLPPYGYNICSTDSILLELSSVESVGGRQRILVGTLTNEDGTTLKFVDNRSDSSVELEMGGFYEGAIYAPTNLTIESLYQEELLRDTEAVGINNSSPHVNLAVNRLYLSVKWDPSEEAFAYDVRLQAMDSGGKKVGAPEFHFVPHDEDIEQAETCIEVTESVRYEVSVRILYNSPDHTPGQWATKNILAGVTKYMNGDTEYVGMGQADAVPAPSFNAVLMNPDMSLRMPCVVEFVAVPSDQTQRPFFTQIYESPTPFAGVPKGKLIYEGTSTNYRALLFPGLTRYYSARTVGPGGVCSAMVSNPEPISAPEEVYSANMPMEFTLSLPISAELDISSDSMPFAVVDFYPPAGDLVLKSMFFKGRGTRIIDASYSQSEMKVQLAVTPAGAQIQTYARGVRMLCPGSMVLNDIPVLTSSGDITKLNYDKANGTKSVVAAPVLISSEPLYVLATAYNWDSGSTPKAYLSGELILIFEYGAIQEEGASV